MTSTPSLNLKNLDNRLSMLEGSLTQGSSSPNPTPAQVTSSSSPAPSSLLNSISTITYQNNQAICDQIMTQAQTMIKIKGVNTTKILEVVEFVVDFVECLATYVPDVTTLVGGALVGQFKLSLAIQLVQDLCSDASNLYTLIFLKDLINHQVKITINQTKQADGTTVTNANKNVTTDSTLAVSKGKKKSCILA